MKIMFVSLGCDKNLVDTEMMLGLLSGKGYEFTDDQDEADVVVVNTCCFINDAKEESIRVLLELAQMRADGKLKALIVSGCLAQRYREEIQKEIPEVDALIGTTAIDTIADTIEEVLSGHAGNHYRDLDAPCFTGAKQVLTTGGHYAYLKIAEGCDKHCTYCIIPKVRGNYRSVPMEKLLEQARELVSEGVRELILVAQETTLYGQDLYGKKMLPELLHELAKIPELKWIRILYCYPEEIDEELIEAIRTEPKVCHYLDMPIQHCNDGILRRMGRKTDKEDLISVITRLREKIPDICIRTTLITGFPGETKEDQEELIDFVDDMEFNRLGVFTYSAEEGTPAARMPDQVDEAVKEEYRREIMELQQAIAFEKAGEMVGKVLTVLIEGKVADADAYVGRTYMDAPNVDGYIFINTTAELMTGDFVTVQVTGSNEYDLIGEIYHEFTE